MPRINQPLLDGMEEHGPVGIALAEIVPPGVDMGVEVHQSQGTLTPVDGSSQQRQRYSVVPAQRDGVFEDRCLLFYEREALRDIAKRNAEVTDVGYRL